ncbi:histidine phosphatase family protein [Dactylosporangium sp. McL0621]|uniref:histidine phosphatase family protein n=1 Tax=Dactylosporangium sp. McL0621 TaxID=3415678 RepID=UPI003CECCCF1
MNSWDAVFLARHGQTQWNLLRRRQGRLDSPLTSDGLAQAHRHASTLRNRGIDGIFVSPLGRALATARIISDALRLEIEVVDELAELDHGQFSGLIDEQIDAQFPGDRQRRAADKYQWRFPDGESYADADPRAARALHQVSRKPAKRPLIVSHEMIGRMLQRHLLGLDPHVALARSHPHDVVFEIDPATRECRHLEPEARPSHPTAPPRPDPTLDQIR